MRRAVAWLGFLVVIAACGAQSPAQPPSAVPGTIPSASSSALPEHVPVRLRIPAIGVDARIEPVGLRDGLMDVPSLPGDVAWYYPGPAPGDDRGDAVIDGHLDWTDGPAVFWRLRELHVGDAIEVLATDGSSTRWSVSAASDFVSPRRPPGLFSRDGPPLLSLVTCSGRWDGHHYLSHRIVTAIPAIGPSPALSGRGAAPIA